MASARSEPAAGRGGSAVAGAGGSAVVLPEGVKIVVAGHFGVGKTTFVGAISEIRPLRTEETLTDLGIGVDDTAGVEAKTTTTVAMDFGRLTIRDDLVLYLFGTPGQDRFMFVWDELAVGALGAVILADTRRLGDTFDCVDYFEGLGLPFLVAVNCFEGAKRYEPDEIAEALGLEDHVPVRLCDARRRETARDVLITLLEHVAASITAR